MISPVILTENSKTVRQEILDASRKTFVKSHARGLQPKMPTEDMLDMKHTLYTRKFIIILQKGGASKVARMYIYVHVCACVRANIPDMSSRQSRLSLCTSCLSLWSLSC